jgi:hypothetical protein
MTTTVEPLLPVAFPHSRARFARGVRAVAAGARLLIDLWVHAE